MGALKLSRRDLLRSAALAAGAETRRANSKFALSYQRSGSFGSVAMAALYVL